MFEAFFNIFGAILKMASYILIPIVIIILIISTTFIIFTIKHLYVDKMERITRPKKNVKKSGFLSKIFYKFPRQLSIDFINKDPYEFNEYGLHMICGEQGAGKSVMCVYLLQKWKEQYPKMQCMTNMDYKYQDYELTHWKDLIGKTNGIFGMAVLIDEIQTWFSSRQARSFPLDMLTELSQQRKQRKCIIGTAQVFGDIGKPIRAQTSNVYLPMTFAGCLTIVRVAKARDYDSDKMRFKKAKLKYFFVHDPKIRESFDTFKKIEKYKEEGFVYNPELHSTSED